MPRPRRSTAAATPTTQSPIRRNKSRKSINVAPESPPEEHMDVDDDADGDEDNDDHHQRTPGPSKRRASRPRVSTNSKRRVKAEEDLTDTEEPPASVGSSRRRSAKQVSYKEVPVEDPVDDDNDDDDDEEVDEDDADEEEEDEPEPVTPAPRKKRAATKKAEKNEDKPYKREPGTGGRGGFSVKGAAAAAARARWDKVRRERAERGEDADETPRTRRKKSPPPIKRDPRGALENVVEGQKYLVKGVEYIAGEDELIIPSNDKGDTKVDAEGRLQGGREYKLVTFTSPSRKNTERVYALTIDAARACGYTDSLAFLRRCPQVVKLSCDQDERAMLIDVGRITGNLKHRMVTMVAMRNVYKLMGARVVKDGKWVDDDYNEEQALIDCTANGYTPHGPVTEEELNANQYPSAGGPGRPPANAGMLADASVAKSIMSSFYTVGGPTTHFGGNGADPWSDVAHGGKRGKLRNVGVTEDDWMLRTAEEARRIDETLRMYRDERIGTLEGDDLRGWVYNAERRAAGEIVDPAKDGTLPPQSDGDATPATRPHPLAREVTFEPPSSEPLSPAPPEPETMAATPAATAPSVAPPEPEVPRSTGGTIVVESEAETASGSGTYGAGIWSPGVIRASYEPHTQMPHVPLNTQPSVAGYERLSYYPLIGLNGAARVMPAPGVASVEFVFDQTQDKQTWLSFGEGTRGADVAKARQSAIAEAEEWAKVARARRLKIKAAKEAEQEQREREREAAAAAAFSAGPASAIRTREPTREATREATATM